MREKRYVYKTSVEKKRKRRDYLGDLDVDATIILKCTWKKEFEILEWVFAKYKTTYQVH